MKDKLEELITKYRLVINELQSKINDGKNSITVNMILQQNIDRFTDVIHDLEGVLKN